MKKLNVALIFGGKSGEHEVSIVSAMSIYKALDKNKYDVQLVGIDKTGRWLLPKEIKGLVEAQNPRLIKLNEIKNSVCLLPFDAKEQLLPLSESGQTVTNASQHVDVFFPVLHGTYGEDGTIQGLLELANAPFVGSSVLGSAVGMDKDVAKRLLRDSGIPVVPFLCFKKFEFLKDAENILQKSENEFSYPYFVKPANMGSSVGVSKVKNKQDALKCFQLAFEYDTKVIVEQAIDGREIECSVLGNNFPQASVLGEVIPQAEFYDYKAKYIDADGAILKIPAEDIPDEIRLKIKNIAIHSFQVLELMGMARVDFFLDKKTHAIYVNEVNTIPGFTSISQYPKLWEASGLPYTKLLDRLIELALERHQDKNALKTTFEA